MIPQTKFIYSKHDLKPFFFNLKIDRLGEDEDTSALLMSCNGCFLVPPLSFISGSFSISAGCEAKSLLFSFAAMLKRVAVALVTPNFNESSDLAETSLLVHLEIAQPQDIPQLLLAARHSHLSVLHKDFLLQEQQAFVLLFSTDAMFPSECSDGDEPMSSE